MAYTLDGTNIRSPHSMSEGNSTQFAQKRTLSGSVRRDYFGSNKKVWTLNYTNTNKTDYDVINTIYQSYLSTGSTKTWVITEANYSVSSTNVHLDLVQRGFSVKGEDYISDFDLILVEA